MPQTKKGGAQQTAEIAVKIATFSSLREAMFKYQCRELEKKIKKEKRQEKLAAKLKPILVELLASDSTVPDNARRGQKGLIVKFLSRQPKAKEFKLMMRGD